MKVLLDLREKLCAMLEEPAKDKKLSPSSLEFVHMVTDTIKNIDKIMKLDQGSYSNDSYSRDGMWRAEMEGEYSRNNSYANRGQHYVRGHYSRDSMPGGGGTDNYSRNYSQNYSGDKGRILTMLKDAMHDAGNDREREALHKCIESLERG